MQREYLTRGQRRIAVGIAAGVIIVIGAFAIRPRADGATGADPAARVDADRDSASVSPDAGETSDASAVHGADASQSNGAAAPAAGEPGPTEGPSSAGTSAAGTSPGSSRLRAGEDPVFAESMGWPVQGPVALPGAILPTSRIVAYYGNPLSKRMGALGEFPKDEMLERLRAQVEEWRVADPEIPVKPALHLVAVVAQGEPGTSGHYRTIMRDTLIERVHSWAQEIGAILFIDIQTGHSDIRELLPRFDHFLKLPDVHLGIDPEFMMKAGHVPGARIGTMDAADINFAAEHLAALVREHDLPPKVLVIHRFTRGMVTNSSSIQLRPEVQVVMHMDGWGAPWLKRDSYRDYIVREPVQYTGFKLFYHNDTKNGDPLMTPHDILRLVPRPLYIQYQ